MGRAIQYTKTSSISCWGYDGDTTLWGWPSGRCHLLFCTARGEHRKALTWARLTSPYPSIPSKTPNFQLIFYSRHFCNQVSHAKPSPLEEQTGNALMSLKSGRMGDFLDYRTKRVTIGVSEEALFSHAASKEGGCQGKHAVS